MKNTREQKTPAFVGKRRKNGRLVKGVWQEAQEAPLYKHMQNRRNIWLLLQKEAEAK